MAYGSAELPLCVHFGTKQSKNFALTSLEKECGFHGKQHINRTNHPISCSELILGRRQTDKDTPLCINNTLVQEPPYVIKVDGRVISFSNYNSINPKKKKKKKKGQHGAGRGQHGATKRGHGAAPC